MNDSVYKVVELIGTSPTSWEEAAKNAVETASKHLEDLRIGEITQSDVKIENGKVTEFRVKVKVSFKYKDGV
ncbi:MAG: dodecin family protein [Spirochaetia bacterium]